MREKRGRIEIALSTISIVCQTAGIPASESSKRRRFSFAIEASTNLCASRCNLSTTRFVGFSPWFLWNSPISFELGDFILAHWFHLISLLLLELHSLELDGFARAEFAYKLVASLNPTAVPAFQRHR